MTTRIRRSTDALHKSIFQNSFLRSSKTKLPFSRNQNNPPQYSNQRFQSIPLGLPVSRLQLFCPSSQLPTFFPKWVGDHRVYCTGNGNSGVDYGGEVDEINVRFADAREDIDAALESKETVYFDEEAEMARESVKEVLHMFDDLLARLPEKEKAAVQRSMGLKMEQLKAELKQLDD